MHTGDATGFAPGLARVPEANAELVREALRSPSGYLLEYHGREYTFPDSGRWVGPCGDTSVVVWSSTGTCDDLAVLTMPMGQ